VLHAALPIAAQVVEAQTVYGWVSDGAQVGFQSHPLGGINFDLEDGILYPLPEVEAFPSETP